MLRGIFRGWSGVVREWLSGAVCFLLAFGSLLFWSDRLAAQETVVVGGYAFPPYVELAPDGEISGLTLDLITDWNDQQDEFRFEFFLTSPARRFSDFMDGNYDLILFESPGWGWSSRGLPIIASQVFLTDADVFIARKADGRGQSYFETLHDKSIAAMLGYHYAFAGFETDPARLAETFDIVLVNGNLAGMHLVLEERVDTAIVTESYLKCFLAEQLEAREELLVAETPDQIYRYRALLRPGAPISMAQVEDLVSRSLTPELLERQCLQIAAWQ